MGLFYGDETAEVARAYLGIPFIIFTSAYSLDSVFIIAKSAPVRHILRLRRFTQIGETVVAFIRVFVINLAAWPRTSHVKPR